jgi:hypothetical protein
LTKNSSWWSCACQERSAGAIAGCAPVAFRISAWTGPSSARTASTSSATERASGHIGGVGVRFRAGFADVRDDCFGRSRARAWFTATAKPSSPKRSAIGGVTRR